METQGRTERYRGRENDYLTVTTPGNRSSLFVITEILQYTVDKSRIEIYLGRNSGWLKICRG